MIRNKTNISNTQTEVIEETVIHKKDSHFAKKPRKRIRIENQSSLLWVSLLAISAIIAQAFFAYSGAQDSDMWWLFATGREILENGFPYQNPFSIYDNQAIVIQQWIPAVIDWFIYDHFGFLGIGILVFIQTMIFAAVAFIASRILMNKTGGEIAWIVIAVMIGVCSAYLSVRPHAWTMIIFLSIIIIMEKYRRGANKKILLFLPLIILLHVNIHMSMMPFDFIIVGCYLFPYIKIDALIPARNTYDRLPICIAIIGMAIAALINPYGIDGALYLLHSLGSAEYKDYISEMGTLAPWDSYYGITMMIMVIIGGIAIGINGLSKVDIPLTLLYLGCVFLSIQHVRNVWLVSIFAFVLLCASLEGKGLRPKTVILRDDVIKTVVCELCCLIIIIFGVQMNTQELLKEPTDSATTPVLAVEYLNEHVADYQRKNTNILTFFNTGGYLEFSGYKVSMDSRPELWDSKIAKNEKDRYREYVDFVKGDTTPGDFMQDKHFDYIIVYKDVELCKYLSKSLDFIEVIDGKGYFLFKNNYKQKI